MTVYKKHEREVAPNYYPVLLISMVYRILQKIIKKQIEDFLTTTGYLGVRKHGTENRHFCTKYL